jgi:hypothetical protein
MKLNLTKKVWLVLVAFTFMLSLVYTTLAHALAVPTLISPADGSTTTADAGSVPPLGIPEFKWDAVPGATWYRLEISRDIGFTSSIVSITTPNTTYTPYGVSNNFADGVWYWHVRVEAPAPVGTYSNTWSFTKQWATTANKPTLISPANSATIDFYDSPIFSWSPVTGAARYKFQIYSSSGGWATPIYTAWTLTTSHQPVDKLANGNSYYWRVVPIDPGDHEGTPSQERSFNADYNFVPVLLEPDAAATPIFTPTFRWTAVRGAQYYRLQYTTDPSFNSGVAIIDTTNTAYTPTDTLPNDVNYYWRVRAHSGASVSDWSPFRTFIKRWYIKPVLLTPTNNYQNQRFPLYSWTPVPAAAKYKVELSLFNNFDPLYEVGWTANTFYTPQNYNGTELIYYWRVTPYDGNDKAGVPSNTASYRSLYTSVAPHQVYPLYYYTPDTYSGFRASADFYLAPRLCTCLGPQSRQDICRGLPAASR